MEALDSGAEPSCHMVVGMDKLFAAAYPTDMQTCPGHRYWLDGVAGYIEPRITT